MMPRSIRFVCCVAALCIGLVQAAHAVTVQRVVSPGGIEAWLVEDHTNPIIAMRFVFRGGAALDPKGKDGTAKLVTTLLDEGAGDLGAQAFQRRLEDLGVSLGFDAGLDVFGGSLRTLTEHRDDAFDMARMALTQPRFDDDAVERMRSQHLAKVRRTSERPGATAFYTMQETFFAGHPYARRSDGTEQTIAALTTDDLRGFVKGRFARDNLVIGVVGDMTPEDLAIVLDQTFGGLPAHAAPWDVAETRPNACGAEIVKRHAVPQSSILFGHEGLKRDDPDYYVAVVLNYILGGGTFNSRLFEEVREKRGLAYSVDSFLYPMDYAAMLLGNAGTANARVKETVEVVRTIWKDVKENGVTETEVNDAKTYLTGSFPLRFSSSPSIAGILAAMQLDDLGIDYLERRNAIIEAISLADVNTLAARLLDPQKLTFFIVGEPEGLATTACP